MYSDIKNLVGSCELCLQRKGFKFSTEVKPGQKASLVRPEIVAAPWSKIALDIAGPLPITEKGNKFLLAITDYFTKYTVLVPMKDQKARTVADAFVTHVITKHGTPQEVLTDRGTNFLSDIMELYNMLRIKKLNTTTFNPAADGQAECQIPTLMNSLAMYCGPNQRDWDTMVPFVGMAYNSATHSATSETPNFLMYGTDSNIPGEITMSEPTFT